MNTTTRCTTPQDAPRSNVLVNRIRGQYREMPGLSLTLSQASRLFGLPEATCLRLLIRLGDAGFLGVLDDGRYVLKAQAA